MYRSRIFKIIEFTRRDSRNIDGLISSGPRERINNDPKWEAISKQGAKHSIIRKFNHVSTGLSTEKLLYQIKSVTPSLAQNLGRTKSDRPNWTADVPLVS